jgi:hypothetical protein
VTGDDLPYVYRRRACIEEVNQVLRRLIVLGQVQEIETDEIFSAKMFSVS